MQQILWAQSLLIEMDFKHIQQSTFLLGDNDPAIRHAKADITRARTNILMYKSNFVGKYTKQAKYRFDT